MYMSMGEREHTFDYRRVMSAGSLAGDRVVNRQGEDLGKIDEFMLDTVTGEVAYVVLSHGGVLGIGDKLFAVPFQALSLDEQNHQFVFDISLERLENAPGFDKNDWPDMAADDFRSSIYGYYGLEYTGRSSVGIGSEGVLTDQERQRLVA